MPARFPQIYRILVLAGIVALLHLQGKKLDRLASARPIEISEVASFFPSVANLKLGDPQADRSPVSVPVLDASGKRHGHVVQTSPLADGITGYVGPTNVLIAFDRQGKNVGAAVRSSADTLDHLAAIERDPGFFTPYLGLNTGEIVARTDLDAVSGATLTSLAIRESINYTFGGEARSLRFPDPITLKEAGQLLPGAVAMRPSEKGWPALEAVDEKNQILGLLLRTGAAADAIRGYRGPTEALLALEPSGERILKVRMRGSYDTLEYAQDVRTEDPLYRQLEGITVDEWITAQNPSALGVEGVSGATHTSYAMAEGIHATLKTFAEARSRAASSRWALSDFALLGFIATALALAFTRLRRHKWFVRLFQVSVIAYLGFYGGHMLAQTLLAGWTWHGLSWSPGVIGLAALVSAAFLVPALTGRNVYCQHLCPHGAAQQLVMALRWKGKQPWRIKIPGRLVKVLGWIPTVLLTVVVLALLLGKGINLAALEPFDAYLWPAAGLATVLVAVVSLTASFFHPMAYCKFGCPTGKLIETARFHRAREGFGPREAWVTGVLIIAAVFYFFG